ncbi:hypothetical protein [Nonomuraea sp. B5E05]|uniref:hypothetical protein n=1 Tax=Nonomuraea sp. B5E05 TaxID=3153569 RepID=UPI00326196F4
MHTRWITRLETLLTYALVIGCLAALVALAANVAIAFIGAPKGISIPLRVFDVPTSGMAMTGVAVDDMTAEAMIRPQDASPVAGLLYLLIWAPGAATGLFALFTRALRRARAGDRALFSTTTAGLLRRIGWILIAGSLASAALGMVAEATLAAMLLTESHAFYPPSSTLLWAVVAGFAALGVSEIVRRGLALLEEVEATV